MRTLSAIFIRLRTVPAGGLVIGVLVASFAFPVVGAVLDLGAPLVPPAAACSGSTNTIYFKGYNPNTLSTHYSNNETISLDRDTTQSFNAACDGKTYWYVLGTNEGDYYNTSGKYGEAYRFSSSGDSYTGTQFTALGYDVLAHATATADGIHHYTTHVDRCTGAVATNPTGFQSQSDGAGHYSIWGYMFSHSAGTCETIGTGDDHIMRIDRVVPTMGLTALNGGTNGLCSPSCGSYYPVNSATVSLTYSATDPAAGDGYLSGLHSVDADTNSYIRWFWSNGNGWQSCGLLTNPGTTANQATLTGTVNCTLPADGSYSLTAVSQDLAGNCSGGGTISSGVCFASGSTPIMAKVLVDTTKPTATFTKPTGSATRWNPAIDLTWTESDGTGGSGVASRSLQRQINTLATCAGTWSNDGAIVNHASPVTQTVLNGNCYRWLLTVTDAAGNTSTQQTSGTIYRDSTPGIGQVAPQWFETWDVGSGDQLAVNVATTNLNLTHPIVTLPIQGSSLSLALVYNSQDAMNIGDGPGWRLNVQRRLTLNGDGTVTFIDATGGRQTFTNPQTVGTVTTYTRPATLYGTLVKDTSQGAQFTLTYRDQSQDQFTIQGSDAILTRTQDRFGNGVTIAYTSGTERISTITDSASRLINVAWDGSNRLSSITDWAYINGSGVVQTTSTGSHRTYRFFYDGSSNLIGWSDPLNTAGTCPTGGSHLTCLTYTSGQLSGISKTQTYEVAGTSQMSSATRTVTTSVTYSGSDVSAVEDAAQVALGGSGLSTSITHTDEADITVVRPASAPMTTRYQLTSATDAYLRTQSAFRHDAANNVDLEQKTVYDATYPIEPDSVTDNNGAVDYAPARTVTTTYQASSLGLVSKVEEPLNATDNRWTQYTYDANNDVTSKTVSLNGTSTQTVTEYCYSSDCTTNNGLTLLKEIDNYVSAGAENNDTNVTTEYAYDSHGQKTSETRHNRDAAGNDLDDRVTGYTYDSTGDLLSTIVNYADGVVSAGGYDITPDPSTGARTDLTTSNTYDTAGNLVTSADPRRAILAATGSPGAYDYLETWTFDALNEQLTDLAPTTPGVSGQKTSTTTYDELENGRESTDFGGSVTGTLFDPTGQTLETWLDADAGGSGAPVVTELNTLDAAGQVLTAKDERQYAGSTADCTTTATTLGCTYTVYSSLGQPVSVTQAYNTSPDLSSQTLNVFDGLGRQIGVVLGGTGGQDTDTTFDVGGRAVKVDDGFTCTTTSYDYRGLAQTVVDQLASGTCTGSGRTTTNSDDGLGRQYRAQVTAGSDTGDRPQDNVFDAAGDALSGGSIQGGTEGTVTTTSAFSVNLLGQTLTDIRTVTVGTGSPTTTTTKSNFDAAGNATDVCTWGAGLTVGACNPVGTSPWPNAPSANTTTVWDAHNQQLSLQDAQTTQTTIYDPNNDYQVSATYTPTASGKEQQVLYGFDNRHRVHTITNQLCVVSTNHNCSSTTSLGSDTYSYDGSENITTIVDVSPGGATTTRNYCYDGRDQLQYRNTTSACSSTSNDESYVYDSKGNRTSAHLGGVTTNFAYTAAGQLCAYSTGTASCATANVTYDADGRAVTYPGEWLQYDSMGRISAACQPDSGCSSRREQLAYDGEGHLISEDTQGFLGSWVTTSYVYDGDNLVQILTQGSLVSTFIHDAAGKVVKYCIPDCATSVYLVTWDEQGDALALWHANADGSVTLANSFTYDSWGTPTVSTANGYSNLGFPFLYLGAEGVVWDQNTSLYYMPARSYNPAMGRFIEPDPTSPSAATYVYAEDNPISKADPSGDFCFVPVVGWALCAEAADVVLATAAAVFSWLIVDNAYHWTYHCYCFAATVQGNRVTGLEFERIQIASLWLNGWWVATHVYFTTPIGGRYLDACMYYSVYHWVFNRHHPVWCIEFKSSSGAQDYYYRSLQYQKDDWIQATYGFPIELVWVPQFVG